MHIHIYETRHPQDDAWDPESYPDHPDFAEAAVLPTTPRDWLLRPVARIAATVESPLDAAEWHAKWIEANPRPAEQWGLNTPEREVVNLARVLADRGDRVHGIVVAGELIVAAYIPCPTVCGKYACPEGRSDGPEDWHV